MASEYNHGCPFRSAVWAAGLIRNLNLGTGAPERFSWSSAGLLLSIPGPQHSSTGHEFRPTITLGWTRDRIDLRVEDRLCRVPIRSHQHLFATGSNQKRAADALAPFPRAGSDVANVAGACDPKPEISRHRAVVIAP